MGNNEIFYNSFDKLIDLENNEVELRFSDKDFKLYSLIGLIVRDNFKANSVSGFSKLCSANHFCRFCRTDKNKKGVPTTEIVSFLRNKVNYNEHVLKNYLKLTGINENSICNTLNYFYVIENFSINLMRDVFKKICVYTMSYYIKLDNGRLF